MHRILSLVLAVTLPVSAASSMSAAAPLVGQISGVAKTQSGQHLAGQLARLRSLEVGRVASVTTTNTSGQFSFTGLTAGSYVVELISNGYIIGTSGAVVLTERDMTAEGVNAMAAGGAQAQAAALAGSFWATTAGVITVAAIAAGVVTAVVVVKDDASPSR